MPVSTLDPENGSAIEIQSEDHGSDRPTVLIHGYQPDGTLGAPGAELLAAYAWIDIFKRRGTCAHVTANDT